MFLPAVEHHQPSGWDLPAPSGHTWRQHHDANTDHITYRFECFTFSSFLWKVTWSTGGHIRLLGSHPALLQLMKLSYEFTADICSGYWLTINIPAVSKHLQPLFGRLFNVLLSRQYFDSLAFEFIIFLIVIVSGAQFSWPLSCFDLLHFRPPFCFDIFWINLNALVGINLLFLI